jgi:hypothetical protein
MLFNIKEYFDAAEEYPHKKELCKKYFHLVQPREGIDKITDMVFYKEYVSLFQTMPVQEPIDLETMFDCELLQQLVAGSFHSYGIFVINPAHNFSKFDFAIIVNHIDLEIKQFLHYLGGFDVLQLFEIFVEEQMTQAILREEDATKKAGIDNRRNQELSKWINCIDKLHFDIERTRYEAYLSED